MTASLKMTPQERESFLAGVHVGVISIVDVAGRAPLAAPIWYDFTPEQLAWRDEIRGALLILSNGSAACSGSLINNTSQDCKNYVLTADHCFSSSSGG